MWKRNMKNNQNDINNSKKTFFCENNGIFLI